MEPAGVLVVRAWVEDGELTGVRARITLSTVEGTEVAALVGAEEICAAFRHWLEGLSGPRAVG